MRQKTAKLPCESSFSWESLPSGFGWFPKPATMKIGEWAFPGFCVVKVGHDETYENDGDNSHGNERGRVDKSLVDCRLEF